jgi:hypothetical protein
VFEEVGVFNPKMHIGEDLDLWARIAMRYPVLGYSPKVCYRRWHDNRDSLTQSNHPRDQVLQSLCDNARSGQFRDSSVLRAYYAYARRLAISYILRAAAGRVRIGPEVLQEAKTIFHLSYWERLLETTFKALPTSVAGKVVGRLVD